MPLNDRDYVRGSHPPYCTCVECTQRRLKAIEARNRSEPTRIQPRRKYGNRRPIFKLVVLAVIVISLVCAFMGIEPLSSYKDRVFHSLTNIMQDWEAAREAGKSSVDSKDSEESQPSVEEEEVPEEATLPSEPAPSPPPQEPTIQRPEVIQEVTQSTEILTRDYTWVYGGNEWTWELQIPRDVYDYYKEIPRPPTQNYSVYVTHPFDDPYLDALVSKTKKAAQEAGFTEFETVEFATAFIQSLPYTADSVTTPYDEYPRYPIETLVDNGGDCEDTSILTASLLNSMGYGVVLIIFPASHCAVGVLGGEGMYGTYWEHGGGKYFYLETGAIGWGFGEMPEEYEGVQAYIYDMTPTPILTHSWSAVEEGNIVELEVTVENLGTAPAKNVYILAGFDAGGGMLWNPRESQPFDLLLNQSITVTLNLQVPLEKHTRLVVQIMDDGYAVDESYSEWFDT